MHLRAKIKAWSKSGISSPKWSSIIDAIGLKQCMLNKLLGCFLRFRYKHQLEPATMLAQPNPSLPPLATNAIAIDLCRSLYILPLSSRQTIKTDHLLFWTFLKISHFICNINSSGFSINCFHSPQNLATVAPSKTLWSAPILTWEGKYHVRFDRLISSNHQMAH